MIDLEAELSAAFKPATAPQQPPCAVDLDLAQTRGRRLRRRRQGLQVSAAMTATALVALLISVPLTGHGGATMPATSPTPMPGTPQPTNGPQSNDPLSTGVTFGWLPSGFHITGGTTEGTDNDDLVAGNGKTTLFVTVLPAGSGGGGSCSIVLPTSGRGAAPFSCATTDQPGQKLKAEKWVAAPGSQANGQGYAELQWETADGRQADLFAKPGDESPDQLATIMEQVAKKVTIGADHALPMPFHLPKPPAGLQLAYAYGSQGADGTIPGEAANGDPIGMGPAPGVAAGLEYGGIDATLGNLPGLELTVQQAVPDAAFPTENETQLNTEAATAADTQSTTVDGHPARIVAKGDFKALVVHDVNGFDVRLSVGGAQALSDVNSVGGLIAYYHTITFNSTDPGTWTFNVFGQ